MKTMKLTLTPDAPTADAGSRTTVENMRYDSRTGNLVPVGSYFSNTTIQGKPLLTLESGGSIFIFSWTDGRLMVFNGTSSSPVAVMAECPTAAIADGDTAIFMRRAMPPLHLRMKRTNGITVWSDVSPSGALPEVRFECVQRRTLSAVTDEFLLEGNYSHWTGPITDTDLLTTDRVFTAAYLQLAEQARRDGMQLQPVMVWWRLTDSSGRELHRSIPLLMSADGIVGSEQIEAKVSLQGAYFRQMKPSAVTGVAFLPGVRIAKASTQPWTVEILMTPPLEVVRLDGEGDVSYRFNGSTATEASLLVGLAQCMPPRTMTELMLDRLETVSQVVMRLPATAVTDGTQPLVAPRLKNVRSEQAALLSALARVAGGNQTELDGCTLPHSFTAGTATRVGDMVLWGNITPVRCRPAGAEELATDTVSGQSWAAGVRAILKGGEELATTASGQGYAPRKLSSLIAYPLAACENITLQVSTAATGGRRSHTFSLNPTPSGRWAMYVDSNLKPLDPALWEQSDIVIQPVDSGNASSRPGMVLAAPSSQPLATGCGIDLTQGEIKTITGASRTQSAWDFARRHLYAFTDRGIFSLAVNSGRTLCSAHMIHPCGVASAALVAVADNGVYAATADNRLVRVSGSTAKEVCRYISCTALGWSAMHGGELWCALTDGGIRLICGNRCVSLPEIIARHMVQASSGRLWLIGDEGSVTDTSSPVTNGFTPVKWRLQTELPASAGHALRLVHVDWDFTSPMTTGRLTVSGHNGNPDRTRTLTGFRLSGAINAPLRRRVPLSQPYRFIIVEFTGNVTGSTRLGTVTLTFSQE